ncbi:hypothetical protein BSG1_01400 [Bacillus sp. SG-1]|nr:hypothetical protein BSG1_01400 [Bacillus sp. SG-1]
MIIVFGKLLIEDENYSQDMQLRKEFLT